MSEESFRVEGLEKVLKKLAKMQSNETYVAGLKKACMLVERSAKQKAPKGNGELRRSITSKIEDIGGAPAGVVFTPLEYAPYVEFGTGLFAEEGGRQDTPWHYQDDEGNWHSTSGMKPQPYMRPALFENKENIIRVIKEGVKQND
jgi:HK97 gp10 family phage protein